MRKFRGYVLVCFLLFLFLRGISSTYAQDNKPEVIYLCTSNKYSAVFGRKERPCDNLKKAREVMELAITGMYEDYFGRGTRTRAEVKRAIKTYECKRIEKYES